MSHAIVPAIIALGALGLPQAYASPAATDSRYEILWLPGPIAHVDARVSSPTCTFGTSSKWASFFDDDRGWSRFISNLSAFDGRGRKLPAHSVGSGKWRVGDGTPCAVRLTYSVDFEFARRQWPPGNEQVAFVDADSVYTTGLPLFLVGEADGPATVKVSQPVGSLFAAPWRPIGPDTYYVPNQEALLSNTIVAGRPYAETFGAGKFQVTGALLGPLKAGAGEFRVAFSRLAPAYVGMFADQREGRYMFVLIPGPEDGESYRDSFAVATTEPPSAANRIIWANHLAHELLHYWIGQEIAPPESQAEDFKWFTEGFTEYLANLTLRSTGIYSETEFRDRMGLHLSNYLLTRDNPMFMKTSLREAGKKGWTNRPIIYSGGAVLAFCLDARIRARTNGARSLLDVMRRLHSRALLGEKLNDTTFVEEMGAAVGEDMSKFYADYVVGTAVLPVKSCARQFGLTAQVQGYDVFLASEVRPSE